MLVRARRVSDTDERQHAVAKYTSHTVCVCVCCLLGDRCVCVCVLSVYGALHEVSPHWHLPARQETTSHKVHTGLEVGEVVDKFEADAAQQCPRSRVTVLVRALRVRDTHVCTVLPEKVSESIPPARKIEFESCK